MIIDDFSTYTPLSLSKEESLTRSKDYLELLEKRRTVRDFSDEPVSEEVIQNIIMTASSAPSGAHKQPWMYCVISSSSLKSKIREAAEKEEHLNYTKRMSKDWLKDLEPFNTDWNKPFIDVAPWIIVVFRKIYNVENGEKTSNYYINESVGISVGFLLSAIHNAGLVALTHTPSPMGFLADILERPKNERAFLLIPVGYPAKDALVPNIERKSLEEASKFYK